MTQTISKNDKLLFLDFDGVCNSYEEGSYATNTDETYGPSETICERIREICEKTGSRVMISSNWRKFEKDGHYTFNGRTVHNPLAKLRDMLGNLVVGTLPTVRHVTKAEALILWMEENGEPSRWVILDDDPRENLGTTYDYGIRDHYMQTVSEFGITEEIKNAIIDALGVK